MPARTVHLPSVIISKAHRRASCSPARAPSASRSTSGARNHRRSSACSSTLARPNDLAGADRCGLLDASCRCCSTFADRRQLPVCAVDPTRKTEILAAAEAALKKVAPNRLILDRQTFADVRRDYFKEDRAMAWLLFGVSAALLVITALGVIGLASFWVQQRTRQIGVRRALGATRGDILRYFQTENFILATVGHRARHGDGVRRSTCG